MSLHKIVIDSTQHEIRTVCVFQSNRAEVKRVFDVELETNDNEVTIENLPNSIDQDSIRIDGLGNAMILDVVYQGPPSEQPGSPHRVLHANWKTESTIPMSKSDDPHFRALEVRHSALLVEKSILDDQCKILDIYSKTLTASNGVSTGTNLEELKMFLDFYLERNRSNYIKIADLDEQVRVVEREMTEYGKAAEEDKDEKLRRVKVKAILSTEQKGTVQIMLTYIVHGASWAPLYDLRAKVSGHEDAPKITLHYRASISQSSGENWNNVNLTLSTASVLSGAEIPQLTPYKIGHPYRPPPILYQQPPVIVQPDFSTYSPMPFIPPPTAVPMLIQTPSPNIPQPLIKVQAAVVHMLNKGETHKVSVAELGLKGKLEWISVPKKQAVTFLRCIVKNNSDYVLLPGPANIYMDDSFVCKSSLEHISPQETFITSLGIDPAIRISYHNLQKFKASVGRVFTAKTDSTSFTQRMTIKNTRSTSVYPLFIKDQIPVSETSSFKVNLVEPKNLGDPKDRKEVQAANDVKARWSFKGQRDDDEESTPQEKPGSVRKMAASIRSPAATGDVAEDGVIEWICRAHPGKSVDLSLSWEVSGPTGEQWVKL